jgi:hypothetical protein
MAKLTPNSKTKTKSRSLSSATKPRAAAGKAKPGTGTAAGTKPVAAAKAVKLLSGGNPQIAKADGDAAVQAYIAAMPGWKSDIGQRLDAIIARTVPDVQKAVRWNSPFYGVRDQGWFLGIHCITKYVKVAFFNGSSLNPQPPVESKKQSVRYFHIYENQPLDEILFENWVRQASKLPGENCF